MNNQKILRGASIVMIIGGVYTTFVSLIAIIGASAILLLAEGSAGEASMYYVVTGTFLLAGLVQLITGIIGIKQIRKPKKTKTCLIWGGVTLAISIIGIILSNSNGTGSGISSTNVIVNILVPALYLYGAFMLGKEEASK